MFQHFGNRLKRDLKQLVDRRLDQSAVISGSAVRVRTVFPLVVILNLPQIFSLPASRLMSSHTSVNGKSPILSAILFLTSL